MPAGQSDYSPIYLSYVKNDASWAERIASHLRQAKLETWSQSTLRKEDAFPALVLDAIVSARVFVLLVSQAYLLSDWIQAELRQMRERTDRGEARIVYVILEQSPWRSQLASPAVPTVVIPKEERVLAKGTPDQVRQDLEDLVQEVRRALERVGQQERQERGASAGSPRRRPQAPGKQTATRTARAEKSEEELEVEPDEEPDTDAAESAPADASSPATTATGSTPFTGQNVVTGTPAEGTPMIPSPDAAVAQGVPAQSSDLAQGANMPTPANAAPANATVAGDKRPEPGLPLAQRAAVVFRVGSYQAMGTLLSPTVMVTPAHVIEQSGVLEQGDQVATIEFLGGSEERRQARVVDIDEKHDFAVLELDRAVSIELPANFVTPHDRVEELKWDSYWTTSRGPQAAQGISGVVVDQVSLKSAAGTLYLKLEVNPPVTDAVGISGAPVVVGGALLGIMAGAADGVGKEWYALHVNEMIDSQETDVVGALLPAEARRARASRSPWISAEDFRRFTAESLNVLADGQFISSGFSGETVHTDHLLLAFARQPSGVLEGLAQRRGVNIFEVIKLRLPLTPSRENINAVSIARMPRVSVNVRRAMARAIRKAGPHGPVDDRHLLFGVLSTSESPQVKALNERGITPDLLQLDGQPGREAVLAGYQSDDAAGADLLDITPEVEALASVLAAKDVEPPLSLGLFGDWGTGKSFFMGKLETEIKRLGEDAKAAREQGLASAYCSSIVQIPFNAWNYIDTDLWASLTAEIFEGLAAAIAERRGHDSQEERALILAAASSSQTIFKEAEKKKNEAEAEFKRTEERVTELQKSDAAIEASLEPHELLVHAVRFAIHEDKVKEPLTEAAKALHIPEAEAAATHLQSQILELDGIWSTLGFTLRNDRKLWVWLAAFPVILAAAWAVCWVVSGSKVSALVASLVTTMAAASAILAPFLSTARKAFAFVQRAKESKQQLIEEHKEKQRAKLNQEREENKKKLDVASRDFDEASAKLEAVTKQLENMRADRKLADYIKERNQSTDYTQRLGIISRVRADLRHLSTLLREVRKEGENEVEKEMKERQHERDAEGKLFPRIDRIILYIDDLDRCPEKNVVEVLQAVHLLLAFPLFVVVVGVDPRWLLYSLQQSSAAFAGHEPGKNEEPEKDEWREDRHWQSTPLNYLEKIFQIPYSLRPISQQGFGQLVDRFASPATIWARSSRTSAERGAAIAGAGTAGVQPAAAEAGAQSSAAGPAPATTVSWTAPEKKGPGIPPHVETQGSSGSGEIATPQSGPEAIEAPTVGKASAETTRAINRSPEHLRISDLECAFMKRLHEFIPTPRAGKRFINIYRLLRASVTEEERTEFLGDEKGGFYQAAMLLLATLTGYPEQATEILRRLMEEKPTGDWWVFVDGLRSEMGELALRGARAATKRAAGGEGNVTAKAAANEDAEKAEKTEWDELCERLMRFKANFPDRPVYPFRIWAPRVARYSFQSGRVLQQRPN